MPRFTKEKWTCSHTMVLITFTGAVIGLFAMSWGISYEPEWLRNLKYFGLGYGPTFIQTFNTSGVDLKKGLYEEYFGYRKVSKKITDEERENYQQWYAKNQCKGECQEGSCSRGICWCPEDKPSQYGHCLPKSEAKYLGDKERYRKPDLPELPEFCYYTKEVDGRVQKVIDELNAHKPECIQKVSYPNTFELAEQKCEATDPTSCFDRDINLVCASGGNCECRQDTKWNSEQMQCELYLDVDCKDVHEMDKEAKEYKEIKEMILGRKPVLPNTNTNDDTVRNVYCNMLEEHSKYHVKVMRDFKEEPTILGYMNVGGAIFFGAGCAFGFMWILMICGMYRNFKRSLDPRNALRDNMTTQEQIAALGVVAGQEYVERQEEHRDEVRLAQMQGR